MPAQSTILVLLGLILGFVYIWSVPGRRAKTLPPGPPTLPVIGNILQIPLKKTYLQFAEWAKQYGDIYSLKIASGTTVVISNRRLVKEIMDKRSSVSSSRPVTYAVDNLIFKGDFLLLMNSNDSRFRTGRKLFHQFFMESAVERKHLPFINAEAVQLMRDLLVDPANFMEYSKRYANSFIMSVTYGIRTPHIKTPHFLKINHIGETMTELVMPGKLPPVDIFGFLHYIPEKFFGNWKSKCLEMQRESDTLYGELMELVMERRKKMGPKDVFADKLVEQQEKLGFNWHEILYMTGVVLDAGTETTSSAWIVLVQMLASRPEVLRQVQEQIDGVVGEDRTPTWDDFPKLPLVNQLMKEVQRFRPVVPIAFPHRLTEAVEIDGYTLPKDSTIVVNIAGLHYDDAKFPNAHDFDPQNYAGKAGLASEYANAADYELRDHYGYGFGRRLCPGIHLAERSLFVTFSKLLWGFDIGPARDVVGHPLIPDYDLVSGYTDGAVVMPQKFKCAIKVRSERRKETILKEFAEAERSIFCQFNLPPDKA